MSFKNLSLKNKLKVLAAFWVATMAGIAWLAICVVTLRNALEQASLWEGVSVMVIYTLLLVVIYRGFGFHRPD